MRDKMTIILGATTLLLLGSTVWSTVQVSALQTQLSRLEASHAALARGTYDFGAAWFHSEPGVGPSRDGRAQAVLLQLQQDDLLREAICAPRARVVQIEGSLSPRNAIPNAIE